jgi:hypothetical protein
MGRIRSIQRQAPVSVYFLFVYFNFKKVPGVSIDIKIKVYSISALQALVPIVGSVHDYSAERFKDRCYRLNCDEFTANTGATGGTGKLGKDFCDADALRLMNYCCAHFISMEILCNFSEGCENFVVPISTSSFYTRLFCHHHRTPASREILPRAREWTTDEMDEFVPKYVANLRKYMLQSNKFFFAIVPLTDGRTHLSTLKPDHTVVLEKYLSREEACVGGASLFFHFLEHYKHLIVNISGLCRSAFKGYYQLIVGIFEAGRQPVEKSNLSAINDYNARFSDLMVLAQRCITVMCDAVLSHPHQDGSYPFITIGFTTDHDSRENDYENYAVYQSHRELPKLPKPEPHLGFTPADFGLLEALLIHLARRHYLLGNLVTNIIGGADQILKEFKIKPKYATVYYQMGKFGVPKEELTFVRCKLSSRNKWIGEGFRGECVKILKILNWFH